MSAPYYLAFDFGTRKIGVAVGQRLTNSANPLATIVVHNTRPDWSAIDRLVAEWSPLAIVLGVPTNSADADTQISEQAREFGRKLEHRYNLPVHWVNERLSSDAANRLLRLMAVRHKHKKVLRDQVAAQLILQSFFHQTTDDGAKFD